VPHLARSRSRHRRRAGAPPPDLPITGPEDALRVVLAVASDPPTPETIVLVLDGSLCGLTCMVCDGASTASEVADVGSLLVALAEREPRFAAAVLASTRPGGGIEPTADDEVVFLDLRCQLDDAGVDLLDWFLLDGGLAGSVGELVDASWRWQDREPEW
jgi:hypothetical protein